ncbi:MAG: hypothetical protein HPY44_07250 [Armatimonadetes bacterium]|nr:hypothetical protein [Armatimonadota bacterium]
MTAATARNTGLPVALAATFLLLHGLAWADGFSGIQGSELRPHQDVTSLLGDLLGGGKSELTKVVVTEDTETRLGLRVSYKRMAGRKLRGTVLGAKGEAQPGVPVVVVPAPAADGELDMLLTLAPDLPEGTAFQSTGLRLEVIREGRTLPELLRTYSVTKKWQSEISLENLVIKVVAEPEGAAAQLKTQPGGAADPIVKPPVQVLKIDPKLLQAAPLMIQPAPAPAPQPPPPAIQTPRGIIRGRTVLDDRRIPLAEATVEKPKPAETPASESPQLTAVSTMKLNLVPIEAYKFGVPPAVTDKGGQGPANKPINWLTTIAVDPQVQLDYSAISRLWPHVYEDKNPASGIFYFLPRTYRLAWRPDEGFGMDMLYMAATPGAEAGNVMMSAELDGGLDTSEIGLAQELVKAYCKKQAKTFTQLVALPISQAPAFSLADALGSQYAIPPEKIQVNAISDALGRVSLSWITDTVTKENLQLALTSGVGIRGTATLTPSGEVPPLAIDVTIDLADPDTLGRMYWVRGQNWRNTTPFPVSLKRLCVLMLEEGTDTPVIYSWSLANTLVPPKAQVEIDAAKVPAWIDARAKRMWLVYSVPEDRDREKYDNAVIAGITGGVTSLGTYNITFKTLNPLRDTGAAELSVRVRSRYFDPTVRDMKIKPDLPLTEDQTEFTLGPIHLVNRQPGEDVPGDPLFEYTLTVVMPDGTMHEGVNWIPYNSLRVLIGTVQIQQALGSLPGAQAETVEDQGGETTGEPAEGGENP